ncbi:MAG: hypothetical protein SF051_04725 [Elusimicrobiota bacterium]|nr:hypothetical protein [Elusimicrobiota bacterium]
METAAPVDGVDEQVAHPAHRRLDFSAPAGARGPVRGRSSLPG